MKKLLFYIVVCVGTVLLLSYSRPLLVAIAVEDTAEILSQALQVAKTIERADNKASALAEVAGKMANLGKK